MSKYLPATWYDPRIEIHESTIHGKGLFAKELIRAGETVMIWGGTIYTPQDLQDISDGKLKVEPFSYSYIDEDVMLAAPPDGLDYFINHSCDPSVWMADEVTVVARRDIQAGEEIKGDYALWEGEDDYALDPCNCGSQLCRGKVTGNDWKLPEVQARYEGHFIPYISRRIAKLNAGS
jgi:uncharacterized protein